ncbi:MAG: hypothetical protein WCF30_16020 [Terracidiphilus sp.]
MRLKGSQQASVALSLLLLFMAGSQLDETFSAVHFWWRVNHPASGEFIVTHWWTPYTVASAFFAPAWFVCIAAALLLSRWRPLTAVIVLSSFLIIEPISCASASSVGGAPSGVVLGLAELPFVDAERSADWNQLERLDERLKRAGRDAGAFPTSEGGLKAAIGDAAFAPSPYMRVGKTLPFGLALVLNEGTAFTAATPAAPGVVYYAVDPSGRQFVLTISGLNAPIGNDPSMMKADPFVREKQPWGGLLALEDSVYSR